MKKTLFVILAFLAIGAVQAQEFSIGPKVGVSQGNISVDGNSYESGSDKLGYHVGAFVRMGGKSLYVQPEVLYTNTGGEIRETQGTEQRTFEASFNRLDVPVMVGLKLADFFRIQAGPVASFLLDSDFSDEIESPDFKDSTLGYQAGIGFDIANMIIDLKYEGSLSKQAESIGGVPTDQRQNQLILSLGLRLF